MNEPSLNQIIKARNQCAEIIALYGEKFLPIFERLENEIVIREKRQRLLDKAINIGSKNGTQSGTHSRGLAPNYLEIETNNTESILAMGAHLKSTFSFVPNKYIYVSQYFGNLDSYEVFERYEQTIFQYEKLFNSKPKTILIDKHPQYQSSVLGKELSQLNDIKLVEIQHHKAHFASVLGEHNLFDSEEKILGVVWDGTGLGDDNNIWGGEFFIYQNQEIIRTNHFEYFDWIANDKMAKEPRLSLFSLLDEEKNI